MKKIKSVKLKNDFNDGVKVFKKNTILITDGNLFKLTNTTGLSIAYYYNQIINNKTDLFEIEYEEERKYIDVRIECDPIYSFPDLDAIEYYLKNQCGISNRLKVTKLAEGQL